jgi:Domain of unknown function (DUF4437)
MHLPVVAPLPIGCKIAALREEKRMAAKEAAMSKRVRTGLIVLVAAAVTAGAAATYAQTAPKEKQGAAKPAATPKPAAKAAAARHVVLNASDMQWGPAPDSLPAGAQMTVLDGDPSKAGVPFVVRAKLPDGYKVGPHWHPTTENVSVISGTFTVGMGDKWDDSKMTSLTAGGFAKMPKAMHHYAGAKGETVIQIHGVGPFAITYINPNDDPRKKKTQ